MYFLLNFIFSKHTTRITYVNKYNECVFCNLSSGQFAIINLASLSLIEPYGNSLHYCRNRMKMYHNFINENLNR